MSSHKGIVLINVFKAKSTDFMMCIQTVNERAKKRESSNKSLPWDESNVKQCAALSGWPTESELWTTKRMFKNQHSHLI